MKLIKALLCFLLPVISFAQTDTIFYNSKGRVCGKDSAATYSFVTKEEQGWLRKEFFADSNKIYRYGYYTAENCAFKNGLSVWHWRGGARDSVFYKNNAVTEAWYFHENGQMSAHEIFKGRELYKNYAWDEAGKKIEGEVYKSPLKKYGYATWKDYVETNMDRNLPKSYQKGKISGTVIVIFKVTLEGTVTDINIKSSSGFSELDEHAMNILKNSPPWSTILSHGRKVYGIMTQTFTYKSLKVDDFEE